MLKKLGLADSTETRKKLVDAYRVKLRSLQIEDFVELRKFECLLFQ
jgi:hypothetical protein